MTETETPSGDRPTQADRRARTRTALLASAARALAHKGYGNLVLEDVARDAGYTRGALYHQFRDKRELTLAAFDWVLDTWDREVIPQVTREPEPTAALFALARGHAVFCRRDIARVAIALGLEFSSQDHPIGRAVTEGYASLIKLCADLVEKGRARGSLPASDTSEEVLARAVIGALEGTTIALAHRAPYDETYAVRAVAGVLGIPAPPED